MTGQQTRGGADRGEKSGLEILSFLSRLRLPSWSLIRQSSTQVSSTVGHVGRVRVLRSLHSQPKAYVLLCVGPAEADQESPREAVVIKQLYLSSASSPTSVDITRLMKTERQEAAKEVRVIHKLLTLPQHPHIVRYHSVSYQQDSVTITMEHCSRGDLLTLLEQQPHKRFPEPQALAIFRQILSGVRFLHTHGIAHRDISLENCLVTQDYTIKICDFGLAASVSSLSRQQVGKLNYMAPEVVRGDHYDPVKADVWSLGIVLFMLLTGSPLFQVAREGDVGFKCIEWGSPVLSSSGICKTK